MLSRYRNGERGASGIRPELATLNARGIAALSGHLKMSVARYALIEPVLWQHLAEFYGHAEVSGYQNDPVPLYAGVAGNTSVTKEFTTLLTWYSVSAGVLNPLQEHITERLIVYANDGLIVYDQYNGNALFVFDLSQPTPPMRIAVDSTLHPAMRFVVTGYATAKLKGLVKTLEKGIVPDNVHFNGANYEAELVRDVLVRLIGNLTQPPPTRRNPRRKINVNLEVANGFFKMLAQTDVGQSLGQNARDIWEVEDISATGFRSVVPFARVEGIKIGSLVGSKPDNVPHWGAGIVRRLSRDDKNNLHIGVEVLSTQIIGVSLTDRVRTFNDEVHVAMYLNRPADASGEAWLLMKPDTFSPNRALNMDLGGKAYLLQPLALVETGDDYDLARFRRMEQDNLAE